MKTFVLYPIPLDSKEVADTFLPFVKRFCETFAQFPPEVDCTVIGLCCNARPTDWIRELFSGLPAEVRFWHYIGAGCDIGACQWAAHRIAGNPFLINCTSRVYFHRAGAIKHLVEAREQFGPGLYGTSFNRDSWRLHNCTRFYALDAEDFRAYPHVIDSRSKGPVFEVGHNNPDGNLMEWMDRRNKPTRLVTFDGVSMTEFHPPNSFRMGDQSAMLVWDRHSDIWANSTPEEKVALTRHMMTETPDQTRPADTKIH